MSERAKRPEPTEEERVRVWDEWLQGSTVNSIHRYDLPDHPVSAVQGILAAEPPEVIRNDLRYRLDSRFFWISASGIQNRLTDREDSLVFVQSPRTYSAKAFGMAIRAIRRDIRAAGGEANLDIVDGIEAEAVVRMVNDRGHRLYRFDEAGAIQSVTCVEVPELDGPSGPSGP